MMESTANVGEHAEAVPVAEFKRERVEWLLAPVIPLAAVTMLVGDPGLGKSMLTCLLAARLSRGDLGEPGTTLMATAEDSIAHTVRPRLEAVEADLQLVHVVRLRRRGVEEGLTLPNDAADLGELIRESAARLVVIDPIAAHLTATINSWNDQSVRRALAPLHALAVEHRCAVLVVGHLNKGSGSHALYRIGGSIGFAGAVRSAILLTRDPDDPDGETGNRRLLVHVKCNLGPLGETIAYEVEPILIPAAEDAPEVETARLRETGKSGFTASEVLAMQGGATTLGAIDEACNFLRETLRNGARLQEEITDEARSVGIALRTLKRAKSQLGVMSRKDGEGGRWTWRLPDEVARELLMDAGGKS
jgi:hypothetical protein